MSRALNLTNLLRDWPWILLTILLLGLLAFTANNANDLYQQCVQTWQEQVRKRCTCQGQLIFNDQIVNASVVEVQPDD